VAATYPIMRSHIADSLGETPGLSTAVFMVTKDDMNKHTGVLLRMDLDAAGRMYPILQSVLSRNVLFCLLVSFFIMYGNTRNPTLSFFGCLSVFFVVSGVFGIQQQAGAGLSMNNLVASTIVVGFSFDYALHFGCCYMASSGNAEERVKASISHLWVTLVDSAITTGASVVLQLTLGVPFFVIVGGMIIITLFVSLLYTLLFLSSLCILFSPGVKSNEPLRALDAAGYMEEEPTLDEQQVMQELESR